MQNRVDGGVAAVAGGGAPLGVITRKRSPSIAMLVSLVSPSGKYDPVYLSNYAYLHVRDVLARLPGVGDSIIFGARDYCMRIWIDPNKASARNLTAERHRGGDPRAERPGGRRGCSASRRSRPTTSSNWRS